VEDSHHSTATRMLFLGERALAEGFALIGFETWPDATVAELDRLLEELRQARTRAFVVVDQRLAQGGSRLLPLVYDEGGRIMVSEVPPLAHPEAFRLDIDAQVEALLGGQRLED
jgi:vacuolar-type H+-ATPase subunit F/Vma7